MKFLTSIIRKIISKESSNKPLGRWNLDYCDKKINHKIDMSNEDHCGPCGNYALEKIKLLNNEKSKTKTDKS